MTRSVPPSAQFGDQPSRREAQVAIEILFGHTRNEQARHLNISIRTLDYYHSRLFRKYGVHNCFGLVCAMLGHSREAMVRRINPVDQSREIR